MIGLFVPMDSLYVLILMAFQLKLCSGLVVVSVLLTVLCQSFPLLLMSTSTLIVMSVLGYLATVYMIPVIQTYMLKKKIFGMDINKRGMVGGDV